MQEIEQQITSLLSKFNKNKSETRSTQINTSIKEDLFKLKKELKTSNNIHVYYKTLLKEKLNHFHQHVNQQKYNQLKEKIQNPTQIKYYQIFQEVLPKFSSHNKLNTIQRLNQLIFSTPMIEEIERFSRY